jgi:hypothetical protein
VFISPAQKAQFAHANVKSGNFSPLFSNAREKNGSALFFPSHLKTGRKTLLDARGTKLLFYSVLVSKLGLGER